jgi:hypothetical protein
MLPNALRSLACRSSPGLSSVRMDAVRQGVACAQPLLGVDCAAGARAAHRERLAARAAQVQPPRVYVCVCMCMCARHACVWHACACARGRCSWRGPGGSSQAEGLEAEVSSTKMPIQYASQTRRFISSTIWYYSTEKITLAGRGGLSPRPFRARLPWVARLMCERARVCVCVCVFVWPRHAARCRAGHVTSSTPSWRTRRLLWRTS